MKIELLAIAALGGALAYDSGRSHSGCGPGGCLMLPPSIGNAEELITVKTVPPREDGDAAASESKSADSAE